MSERSPAREAAAAAAADLVSEGMTIGLGSGRAVWRVTELLGDRLPGLRVAVASERTDALARECGLEVIELDGSVALDLALDGADEIDPGLRLIKGGGGALLRERIVIAAAERFVVVAETSKRVERLGEGFRLPVEVVRFGWRDTRRRLSPLLPDAELRGGEDDPFVTDEGHLILDCLLDGDPDAVAAELGRTAGVVDHGLFIGMAERALLGTEAGGLDTLVR